MKSIKSIIENSFPIDNWNMVGYKQEAKDHIGHRIDRDLFIQKVEEMFNEDRIMMLNGEWHRDIGKSMFLMKVAEEYNIPIIVNTNAQASSIRSAYEYINNKPSGIKICTYQGLRDIHCFKYVLVDLINNNALEVIERLKNISLTPIGFIANGMTFELI